MNNTVFELNICDGKYTYKYDGHGRQEVLRHGMPWCRDLSGDKFVFSLAVELDEANKELTRYRAVMEQAMEALDGAYKKDLHDDVLLTKVVNAKIALRKALEVLESK